MDFSSFNLQESEDLFKQNYQLNTTSNSNNNNITEHNNQSHGNSNNTNVDTSTDFFNFMNGPTTSYDTNSNNNNNSNTMTSHHGSFSVPQLSPDRHEGSFTNSSVLSGQNPEFNMSPLQIASQATTLNNINNSNNTNHDNHNTHNNHTVIQLYHTPLQQPSHPNQTVEDFADEEEFFTPLVSPAMAPTYNDSAYQSLVNMGNHENIFSPLSSPALHPSHASSSSSSGDQNSLQQKLAFIERQQQQLRNMHNQLRPGSSSAPSPILNGNNNGGYTSPLVNFTQHDLSTQTKMNTKKALHQKIAKSSPQFHGSSPQFNGGNSPRTFAVPKTIKPSESPLALKPMTPHTSFVNKSPTTKLNNNSSSSNNSNNGFIAPATPSLLMKLGGGSNNLNSSPTSAPMLSSSAVDNMPVLPAAMLQEDVKKPAKPIESSKRRRISQPSPGLPPTNHDMLASPASLRPQQSPRALKPLISPSLKPNGKRLSTIEEETARALLTSKSNYENLKEGKAKSLGIDFSTTIQSGIENRRSAHKAAEQKRRDTLKQSFDSLRTEIIDAIMEEEIASAGDVDLEDIRSAKEKDVKQMSKVVLLQHSYEYILRLKNDNKRKDEKQLKMRQELTELRKKLGLPEVTEEEKEAEAKEKQEENERRLARLKRLQTAAAANNEDGPAS